MDASTFLEVRGDLKVLGEEDTEETLVEGGDVEVTAGELAGEEEGEVGTVNVHGVVHPECEQLQELLEEFVEEELVFLGCRRETARRTLALEEQVDLHLGFLDTSLVVCLVVLYVRVVFIPAIADTIFVTIVSVGSADGLCRQAQDVVDGRSFFRVSFHKVVSEFLRSARTVITDRVVELL